MQLCVSFVLIYWLGWISAKLALSKFKHEQISSLRFTLLILIGPFGIDVII